MGILDGLLNAAMSGMQGGAAQAAAPSTGGAPAGAAISPTVIMSVVAVLIQQQGGVGGLLEKFNKAGLGDAVKSWVGTGQNQPVSTSQVTQVLGSGQLSQVAAQLGIDPAHAGGLLAQMLPHVVDQLTPQGQLPPQANLQGDTLNATLMAITGKLFSVR